jgi:hypothetical protein
MKCRVLCSPRWLPALVLGIALGCSALQPARAVLMVPLTLDQLTAHADLVLEGRVQSLTCRPQPDGRLRTEVQLDVSEVWKGPIRPGPFTVVLAGGTLGNRRSGVTGQASYRPGEDVVVFLRTNARGEGVTLGLAQGKFAVNTDPGTGIRTVQNLFHGGQAVSAATLQDKRDVVAGPLTLEDLRRHVSGGAR